MSPFFSAFLKKFPLVSLPLTLRDDSNRDFENNEPLSPELVARFIQTYEPTDADDFTEYMACFSLPKRQKEQTFQVIVYWKAMLMNYDFVLATYDIKTEKMIAKRVIAGLSFDRENNIIRTLASVSPEYSIIKARGAGSEKGDYEPDSTLVEHIEVSDSGLIE
jgi:hypothetical protein